MTGNSSVFKSECCGVFDIEGGGEAVTMPRAPACSPTAGACPEQGWLSAAVPHVQSSVLPAHTSGIFINGHAVCGSSLLP